MKLVAQQSNYRFLSDTKLIVTALEHKGVFTELFSKNKEGEFADIAFQDSLGRVYYLNNQEHFLRMYKKDILVWEIDFIKTPITFLVVPNL